MIGTLAARRISASVTWTPVDPLNPRWYTDVIGGGRSDAGPLVLPETALQNAVVYRAVNVLAHAIADAPLVVYRRTADRGKERALEHPQYDLLHRKPNNWMTSWRWRHLIAVQAVLWGGHYSQIWPGPGGIGQLVPLSPETTRIVDQLADGRLVYVTRDRTKSGFGEERRLIQDDIFHVRGFSIDGKSGIPLARVARNAIGLALAAERHGSVFMRRGARFAGFLSTAGSLDPKARKENEEAWASAYGGVDGTGRTPVLTGGMQFQQVSMNNRDSQWLEARTFQVEELLRFLGVPGVLVGYADKTSTYASAEQFFLSFVKHTVQPWTENIAAELNFSVVTDPDRYFADFVLEGLLKGDVKTRYQAHQLAIQSGWKNRNEVRVEENYNRGPDELDEFLQPMNMAPAGTEPDDDRDADDRDEREDDDTDDDDVPPIVVPDPNEDARGARLAAIARRAVERLVRKEFAAILGGGGRLGAAARYADNPSGWRAWLNRFYDRHAGDIAAELDVSDEDASSYCRAQADRFASLTALGDNAEIESIAALARLVPDLNMGAAA